MLGTDTVSILGQLHADKARLRQMPHYYATTSAPYSLKFFKYYHENLILGKIILRNSDPPDLIHIDTLIKVGKHKQEACTQADDNIGSFTLCNKDTFVL